jgi:hypothetical protein
MRRPSQPRRYIEEALRLYISRKMNGFSVKDIVKLTGVPKAKQLNMWKSERSVQRT